MYHLHSIKAITSDERKTLTKISTHNLSRQFPQTSAHFGHDEIRKPAKSIVLNWKKHRAYLVENPEALGFHQKIQERRKSTPRFKRKQEDHNWFCIELYIIFTLCVSARNVKQLNNI